MAASDERWWGLFVTDNSFELLPTTIAVNTVRDVILDREDGEFTGKEVVTDKAFLSVFLMKGPIALESGVVKTVFFGSASIPSASQEGRRTYLSLSLDASAETERSNRYSLNLENFTRNEILKTVLTFFASEESRTQKYELGGCCDMTGPSLIWAGDLDRDGKLDFLLDSSTHYNVSKPTLFLSSPASEGEIVRPVARIRSVGC